MSAFTNSGHSDRQKASETKGRKRPQPDLIHIAYQALPGQQAVKP